MIGASRSCSPNCTRFPRARRTPLLSCALENGSDRPAPSRAPSYPAVDASPPVLIPLLVLELLGFRPCSDEAARRHAGPSALRYARMARRAPLAGCDPDRLRRRRPPHSAPRADDALEARLEAGTVQARGPRA